MQWYPNKKKIKAKKPETKTGFLISCNGKRIQARNTLDLIHKLKRMPDPVHVHTIRNPKEQCPK